MMSNISHRWYGSHSLNSNKYYLIENYVCFFMVFMKTKVIEMKQIDEK
jgi:hypothetical protein